MKKLGITMMLILIPLIASSQEVVIDTQNKTITLNREKKIEVAKIILNENALFEENKLLKEALLKLETAYQKAQSEIETYKTDVSQKTSEIIALQKSIIKNNEALNENKVSDSSGFYVNSGFTTSKFGGISLGGSYIINNMFIGASFNPKNKDTQINTYTINLGLKLF